MRKGIGENRRATTLLTSRTLEQLKQKGYLYVQIRGLTIDNHYDYIEPSKLILIPMRELPADPAKKDIYAAIDSDVLASWARDGYGVWIFV